MKKKIIITIMSLITITIILTITNQHKPTQTQQKIIKAITQSYTIGDSGTEIEVKLTNPQAKKTITATLYDQNNQKITTITKQIKNKNKIIKITTKEKYPTTSKIKYKIK